MAIVPYSTRLARLPLMGTGNWLPTGDQQARRGGVSVSGLASVNSTTVRLRPARPRFSPLLPHLQVGERRLRIKRGRASSGSLSSCGARRTVLSPTCRPSEVAWTMSSSEVQSL